MFLMDFSRLVISFKVAIFRTWIHCGCTAQAESPAAPARGNMAAPAWFEGRSDRLHSACAGAPQLPSHLVFSCSLASSRHTAESIASFGALPGPHLRLARGCYLPLPPRPASSASGCQGPAFQAVSVLCSRWESQISLPLRPSPTGSNPRVFRNCAGIARCARSNAGTRMALSVIVCPNLIRDNCCWLQKILSSLWIIFQKNFEMTF